MIVFNAVQRLEKPTGDLASRWEGVMMPNYATPRLEIVEGKGATVIDAAGRRYLDLLAGLATNVLGHAHPAVVRAVSDQVAKLGHTSNLYAHPEGLHLAERLSRQAGGRKVLFLNSGTEANEAAHKLVRRRAHTQGRKDAVVLAFDASFHGRTMGSLSLTGQANYREGFGALPGPVHFVPFNDVAALQAAFAAHDVAGVFAECVQGEGGVVPMAPAFAKALVKATSSGDALLVIDEVQTGMGRTGRFFAHEHFGLDPDVITMAKALGGGLPLGAMLTKPRHAAVLGPGTHGCTFGGNPVAAAAGNAVLDVLQKEGLVERAARLGKSVQEGLEDGLSSLGIAPRGLGLLIGVPLPRPVAATVAEQMEARAILVGQAGKSVTRIAPPLIVDPEALGEAIGVLSGVVGGVLAR